MRLFDSGMYQGNVSVKVDSRYPKRPPDYDEWDNCNEVYPNLFISPVYVLFRCMLMRYHIINITSKDSFCRNIAQDKKYLKTLRITHVLNAAKEESRYTVRTGRSFMNYFKEMLLMNDANEGFNKIK